MRRNFQLTDEQENLMRPSKVLGYDRDNIGIACLEREMYEVALSQFNRAIYLNPYEVRFKKHLAWCYYKCEKYTEALQAVNTALEQKPDDKEAAEIKERITSRLTKR
jgi:tetratricopeptide (TPR) repeat protein